MMESEGDMYKNVCDSLLFTAPTTKKREKQLLNNMEE